MRRVLLLLLCSSMMSAIGGSVTYYFVERFRKDERPLSVKATRETHARADRRVPRARPARAPVPRLRAVHATG